jgi:hypothetical protein
MIRRPESHPRTTTGSRAANQGPRCAPHRIPGALRSLDEGSGGPWTAMVETLANHLRQSSVLGSQRGLVAPKQLFRPGSRNCAGRGIRFSRRGIGVGRPFWGPIGVFLIGFVRLRIHFPVRSQSDPSSLRLVSGQPGSAGSADASARLKLMVRWWGLCQRSCSDAGTLVASASWRFRRLRDCLTSPCTRGRARSKGSVDLCCWIDRHTVQLWSALQGVVRG